MNKSQRVRREYGHGKWTFYDQPTIDLPPLVDYESSEVITFNHNPYTLGAGDVGGPFWSSQRHYEASNNYVTAQGLGRVYEGTIHFGSGYGGVAKAKPSNFDSEIAAGATAISRTIPTNPISGASVAIGEAREGFPRFVGSTLLRRTRDLRNVGDEYLNVEFGWKPMIRDLQSFARAVKDSNKVLKQLYRDSGTNTSVRTRYRFPTQSSGSEPTTPPDQGWFAPYKCDRSQLDAWMLGSGPQPTGYRSWYSTETKTWFSGAYSYVMPPPPRNFVDQLHTWDAEANKLFGTRLTPEVVWNLAPWSWAADWFSNTGDVLHNMSQFGHDGLVLKYGYIMRQTTELYNVSWQGYINQPSGSPRFVQASESNGTVTKLRLRATPFGFGIDMGGLTPRQMAISAAVGLTQAPRISL